MSKNKKPEQEETTPKLPPMYRVSVPLALSFQLIPDEGKTKEEMVNHILIALALVSKFDMQKLGEPFFNEIKRDI